MYTAPKQQQLIGTAGPSTGGLKPSATPYQVPQNPGVEAQYNQQIGDNNTGYTMQANENAYQRRQLSNEYGIDDASNPFSKMRLLQESYERDKLGTDNSFASAGQFFSGARKSNQDLLSHTNDVNVDALHRAYDASKHDLDYSDQTAGFDRDSGNNAAAIARLLALLGT